MATRRGNIQDHDIDYTARGLEITEALYRGVGNSEVRTMVQQYFPGLCMSELKETERFSALWSTAG